MCMHIGESFAKVLFKTIMNNNTLTHTPTLYHTITRRRRRIRRSFGFTLQQARSLRISLSLCVCVCVCLSLFARAALFGGLSERRRERVFARAQGAFFFRSICVQTPAATDKRAEFSREKKKKKKKKTKNTKKKYYFREDAEI